MDTDTARLVAFIAGTATVLGGLLGVGGACLGAWIAQRGARRTAQITLDGQRQMATDDALRRWRMDDVRPLLEAITRRSVLFAQLATQQVGAERLAEGGQLLPQGQEEANRLIEQLAATPDWNIYAAPLRNVASGKMIRGLALLQEAENEAHRLLVHNFRRGKPLTGDEFAHFLEAGARFSAAQAIVHDAAVDYIAQSEDLQPVPHVVQPSIQPWWLRWRR